MDISKLTYFVEIGKAKSLSSAAELLFLTRQSLSQSLKAMENELGVTLCERKKTGLELTEAGKCLYDGAEQILARWQETHKALGRIKSATKKVIRVGFGLQSYNHWPIDHAARFERAEPGLSLDVNVILPDLLWQQLAEDSLDMLVTCVFPKENKSVSAVLLRKVPTLCMMGSGHPLASCERVTPKDFCGHKIYEYSGVSAYNKEVRDFFAAENIPVEYAPFVSTDLGTVYRVLSKNDGVWPVSAIYSTFAFEPDRITFRPFVCADREVPSKDVFALVKRDRADDPALKKYIAFLKNSAVEI